MPDIIDATALQDISCGLYVVSSTTQERLSGQIANTVFQVTAQPAAVAVSINKKNLTCEAIERSGYFAVSILEETTPMDFIGLFGFRSGREVNKFESVRFETGVTGCPVILDHSLAVIEAKVVGKLDVGTHLVFWGHVVSCRRLKSGIPLTYARYYEKKGRTPKTAPTYHQKDEDLGKKENATMKKYLCKICGYVYDPAKGDPDGGIAPGTPFEKIPDSWVCPVCGAAKSDFAPQ